MIKNIYDVTLKLITPSKEGDRTDFTNKESDILDAVYYFNEKFRMWNKRIIIYMISKKSIHLLLIMEKEKETDHVTAREIRFFTMYLNNEKEWNQYSRNSSKLFESVNFELINLERAQQQIGLLDKNSQLYDLQLEEVEYLNNFKPIISTEPIENGDMDITDDEMTAVIRYLVETKTKGQRSEEKAETINKVKKLLEKWM